MHHHYNTDLAKQIQLASCRAESQSTL